MAHKLLTCRRCKWRGRISTDTCPKCGHPLIHSIKSGKKGRTDGFKR